MPASTRLPRPNSSVEKEHRAVYHQQMALPDPALVQEGRTLSHQWEHVEMCVGAGERAQSGQCLLHKCKRLSSDLQNGHRKLDVAWHTPVIPSTEEVGRGGSLELIDQTASQNL